MVDDAEHEKRVIKLSVVDEWIYDLKNEIDKLGADREPLETNLAEIEDEIEGERNLVAESQSIFDEATKKRGELFKRKTSITGRIEEIDELLSRFELLDGHYEVDLQRLASIKESGVLLTHQSAVSCPLCGAAPSEQHFEKDCDGNIDEVVAAAEAEIKKIFQLKRELKKTVDSLVAEKSERSDDVATLDEGYKKVVAQIKEVAAPKLGDARAGFSGLLEKRDMVRQSLSLFHRLDDLEEQKEGLIGSRPASKEKPVIQSDLSKSVLQEFSMKIESILEDWGFPDIGPVYFDESTTDFVINGKPRGSRGKGLRAITHAAITIGLMDYCLEKNIPHPGFVAIDSPLLSYYEPEGDEDNLQGTDLKERFYKYVSSDKRQGQIIIIDNEHPPESIGSGISITVFSKNPDLDRYGFFPMRGN